MEMTDRKAPLTREEIEHYRQGHLGDVIAEELCDMALQSLDGYRAGIEAAAKVLQDRIDHHDVQSTMADASDMPESVKYHERFIKELIGLMVRVRALAAQPDAGKDQRKYGDPIPGAKVVPPEYAGSKSRQEDANDEYLSSKSSDYPTQQDAERPGGSHA
jgi:hypothetical protein